ncbi:MAG: hypothetical protein ACHRHE_00155 [Tepidisphaerales bacterium]
MRQTLVIGLLIGLAGIVIVRSLRLRPGGSAERMVVSGVVEPIDSFLPRKPSTRPVARDGTTEGPLTMVLDEVDYLGIPLADVIEDIRQRTGANVDVDWRDLKGVDVEESAPVTLHLHCIPASRVLQMALDQTGEPDHRPGWQLEDDDVVHVASAAWFADYARTRIYNIRDIVVDAIRNKRGLAQGDSRYTQEDNVVSAIRDLIMERHPESWLDAGGKVGNIRYINGKLVVYTTEELQVEAWEVLEKLRGK